MKILIITPDIAKSAAGKVSENIINGLFNLGHEIMVICAVDLSTENRKFRVIEIPHRFILPDKLSKLLNIIFLNNFKYKYWEFNVYRNNIARIALFNPDIIYALGSGGNETVLNLGLKISRRLRKPMAIHLPDPIPAPKGWETYEIYRKCRIYNIKEVLKNATLISMGNPAMLKFQQSNVKFDILEKSFILPDPIGMQSYDLGPPPKKNIITYLGSFYGARKPDSLLYGFAEYYKIDQTAELHIVGENKLDLSKTRLPESVKKKIIIRGWTNDIKTVYAESSVLVDVSADIPDDVFISSKLKGYLQQPRMIVLITHPNSPSMKFLASVKNSVVFSDHNFLNVSRAIESALKLKYNNDIFLDRKSILEYLDINRISKEVSDKLEYVALNYNKKSE